MHFCQGPISHIAPFVLIIVLLLAALWLLAVWIERITPFVLSLLGSITLAIADNPYIRAWRSRHPRLSQIIANRLNAHKVSGLTSTVLGAVFLYLLFIYAGTTLDFLLSDPIVQTDHQLANLLYAYRDTGLVHFFTVLTALGDWKTVTILSTGVLAALLASRRYALASGLVLSVLGDVFSVALLKIIFHRPRPDLAYFAETSGSFPSGHAAISIAFFGMVFFITWRLRLLSVKAAVPLAASLAFMIGLSRLYLAEHYLSDVLNGYIVGALWLLTGIALALFLHEKTGKTGKTGGNAKMRRLIAAGAVIVSLAGSGYSITNYHKPLNKPGISPATHVTNDIPALFASGALPAMTRTITGMTQEPINIVIVTRDASTLTKAMHKAGWNTATRPGFCTLMQASLAAWANREDARAPVTPYFWNRQPNDFGFEKPTAGKTLRKRHHVRFWKTNNMTPDGSKVFAGTASFDDGLKWGITHRIDPNIDAERDFITRDLTKAALVSSKSRFQTTTPLLGYNFTGDAFFTDGKVVLLRVKP